ncbi:MAG TPA: hypothetical protein VJ828_16950 [Lacipirellulaceae bacterium]|nr:hypothetical protein [Lacipirellulaceae bacterium]
MSANRGLSSLLAGMLICLLCTHLANAQAPVVGDPRPLSNIGGAAGAELGQIYGQDVGYGYSAASINRHTMLRNQVRAPYGPGSGAISQPRIGLGAGTSSPASKPFSGYTPSPTVSPYLNLFREDLDGTSDFNYQTLVRPMLQQQQINQQVERQAMEMARRMQSMAAQSDFAPQGSTTQFPTGHQSVFMYYGHYYPTAPVRRR